MSLTLSNLAGETVIAMPDGTVLTEPMVHINGASLTPALDYVWSATTITLAYPIEADSDTVVISEYGALEPLERVTCDDCESLPTVWGCV